MIPGRSIDRALMNGPTPRSIWLEQVGIVGLLNLKKKEKQYRGGREVAADPGGTNGRNRGKLIKNASHKILK